MAGKERPITASVDTAVPRERVWEVVSDTQRCAEWVESTVEVVRTDGSAAPGTTHDELTRIRGPWKTATHWRVTEFKPPTRQVHEGDGVITECGMAVVLELTPKGESTHFTVTLRYTPRFGALGAALDRAVEGSMTRAQQRSRTRSHAASHANAQTPDRRPRQTHAARDLATLQASGRLPASQAQARLDLTPLHAHPIGDPLMRNEHGQD